ncbi:flagellar basal-body MS-ring/collar protein FliF [Jonesia quinghaiensis]|uniref:flagellar basal-body MS-ring/collar protein FliF n=1 Tax=Jonesia quinghaiensis TaxID=262806 RepID=UPI000418C5D1|nr:flagellar basal-body MS-ring/collar protein FliF [Jonesia quinghaiensis]
MPQQITNVFARLFAAIREFTVAQRTLALIGMVGVVIAIVALATWASKPQMQPLYTDLAPADAAAIVDQLAANGVEYQLTNGGSTILVPSGQVYDQRLKVASSGITPSAEGGYSLLDNMGMTSSDFQQNVTYKRALEGEIAKTINAMDGIELATVQLAMPEDTVFVSQEADPTASVFVKPRAGVTLGDDQVQAISQFVSASVEGMKVENVAVIGADGRVLSAVGAEGTNGANLKETQQYEQRIADSLQGMLDRIVGPGKAVVSVTAELDFDATERVSEAYDSNEDALPLTERETNEEFTGGGNAAGVLGPDNIAVPNGDADSEYNNTSIERNNAVDKTTERTVTAPGTVRRQSVSVAVDEQAAATININDLQDMVTAAAGVDEERGDTVTVTRMAFDNAGADAAAEALAAAEAEAAEAAQMEMYRNIGIAVIALLAIMALSIVAARKRKNNRIDTAPDPALDLGEVDLMPQAPMTVAQELDQIEFPEMPELPAAPDEKTLRTEKKRQDVITLADEDPGQMAEILQEWINTGGR